MHRSTRQNAAQRLTLRLRGVIASTTTPTMRCTLEQGERHRMLLLIDLEHLISSADMGLFGPEIHLSK